MAHPNVHPNVEDLNRVVLVLSNEQEGCRNFIEVPDGSPDVAIQANVSLKKQDVGWFSQAWFAEKRSTSKDNTKAAYTLRNIRSGTYLQVGEILPDGSRKLEMAAKATKVDMVKRQTWEISNDGGFARIANPDTKQVFELINSEGSDPPRVLLKNNDTANKDTQTWKYERVSRSASDITAAMKANGHIRKELTEYQSTDACYLVLPPPVRTAIWEKTGLGRGPLTWRNQIFDCDDFAFAAKSAVSRWTAENLNADGFSMLFGVTFGQRGEGANVQRHAYNWYLDWDTLSEIVFFEPSKNLESYDGWKYEGFNGIF